MTNSNEKGSLTLALISYVVLFFLQLGIPDQHSRSPGRSIPYPE